MTRHATRAAVIAMTIGVTTAPMRAQPTVDTPLPPIQIDSGTLAGKVLSSGVKTWLGIPYVQAPVRELRWAAPEPITWRGIYNADRTMPECIQILRPHDINHYFGEEPTSEDCLYLNVWAPPDATADAHLPVIVYIYGGGSTVGSSGMALYDGEQVALRGAVFVNFNYRLGILGFMAHPALTRESGRGASGNWAYLDMVAALQWIQRNIAQFGGDPSKVVISGQSAGAGAVSLLQASPLAAGLFRGAVAMSGGTWRDGGQGGVPLEDAERVGLDVQDALQADSIADMRDVPADRLLALQAERQLMFQGSGTIRARASIDGYFLPETPANLFATGQANDVPVIAGFANDEGRHPLRQARTASEYRELASQTYGARTEEFLTLYPVRSDADVENAVGTVTREAGVMRTARNWALAQSSALQHPVFIYNLTRIHPFNPDHLPVDRPDQVGAYHTSDVPFWFGTLDAFNLFRPMRLWSNEDRALSARLTASLIAFAETGRPSTPDIDWPAWSPARELLIEIGEDGVRTSRMNTSRLQFMAETAGGTAQTSPRR